MKNTGIFTAESRVLSPVYDREKAVPHLCHPAPWRSVTKLDGKRNCWMEASSHKKYICLRHLTQILKPPNKLDSLSAGLNSSFHQVELWSVLHTWLPWAPSCGAGNGRVHTTCPSNVIEREKVAQIILVSVAFVIFKDESHLTKKWAIKCVLQSYCLEAAFMPADKIGKYWILGGPYCLVK